MSQYSLINRVALGVLAGAMILLGGCDDPPHETPPPGVASLSQGAALADRRWLEVKDDVAPAVWLASREGARDAATDEPAVSEMRAILVEADRRYYEGQRMIANRAVQVEEMLAENGVRESARSVIEGLVGIAVVEERAGFGEACQHYATARIQGASRTAALGALRRDGLPPPADAGGDRR
jgi:hypothetical protein